MSKFVQALFTGMFFTFILDFFLFLGIQQNYIDFYDIDLYYNILFADNQNIYLFAFFTMLIGFMVTYINNHKLSISVIAALSVIVALTLIPPIGNKVGEMMFMKKGVVLKNKRHTFVGDIYYEGRKKITFYDVELEKMIAIDKKDLKQ